CASPTAPPRRQRAAAVDLERETGEQVEVLLDGGTGTARAGDRVDYLAIWRVDDRGRRQVVRDELEADRDYLTGLKRKTDYRGRGEQYLIDRRVTCLRLVALRDRP